MYDRKFRLDLAVGIFVGDKTIRTPIIDEEMIRRIALQLQRDYSRSVQYHIGNGIELRRLIDCYLDKDDTYLAVLPLKSYTFDELDRQEILSRCAEIICEKIQKYIPSPFTVLYHIAPNGRVIYRLKK